MQHCNPTTLTTSRATLLASSHGHLCALRFVAARSCTIGCRGIRATSGRLEMHERAPPSAKARTGAGRVRPYCVRPNVSVEPDSECCAKPLYSAHYLYG